jgi:hypothetical protein
MFGNFVADNPESPLPLESPAGANPVVAAAMASSGSLAENEPDLEGRVLIEVDTANPSPTTIAFAEAIILILQNANRVAEPTPKRRPRRQGPASQASAPLPAQSTLSHHARHCTICHHPERQAIEEEFIHWHSPKSIASGYTVGLRSVYRHARALGLFERRAAALRDALGHIIEKVENASITADAVVRAVHAHAHLSYSGRWVNQPSLVVPSSPSASSELIDTPVE